MVALVNAPNKIGNTKTFLTDCFLLKKPKLSHFFIYIVTCSNFKNRLPDVRKANNTKQYEIFRK